MMGIKVENKKENLGPWTQNKQRDKRNTQMVQINKMVKAAAASYKQDNILWLQGEKI
jgi:hypothetical protein